MLEGLLVDLVPQGADFAARDYDWRNSEARYWTSGGDRAFFSHAASARLQHTRAEMAGPDAPRLFFGIRTKDGTPIGMMGLPNISYHNRWAMLAARIGDSAYWGGGYGTDALLLLVDYCFDWLDLRRVCLKTMTTNVRVHRQMEKVGFVNEGVEREATFGDGAWCGWVCYGLLREEWPGRAAKISELGLRAKGSGT